MDHLGAGPEKPVSFHMENMQILLERCTRHTSEEDRSALVSVRNRVLRSDLHMHARTEIFAVESGTVAVTMAEQRILLTEGDVIVIAPGFPHRADAAGEDGYVFLNARFSCDPVRVNASADLFGLFGRELPRRNYILLRNSPVALDALRRMVRHSDGGNMPLAGPCLFEGLMELWQRDCREREAPPALRADNESMRISLLDPILSDNYMDSDLLSQLTERLSLSVRQVERLILKEYGMPLRELIAGKRIAAAQALLRTSELPVQQIAAAVGYATPCCFYTAFRKRTGMTPMQYRRSVRNPGNS